MSLAVRLCSATLVLALLSACSNGATTGNAAAVLPAATHVAPGIALHPGNQRRLGSGWQGPTGIATDPATHDVYVSESFYGTVKKIAADGKISVFAKGLKDPYGLAFDPKTNDLFVAENSAKQIVAIAPDGTVTKIAAGFNRPIDVSVDPTTRTLYVADNGDNSIYEVNRDGKSTRIATVQNPNGVAFDGASNDLYIAGSTKVFRLKPDGQLTAIGSGWGAPIAIAVDPSTHYVYVADYGARAVKEIGPDGTVASVSFSIFPWSVAVDKETHDIYITDKIGNAVWRIDAAGQQAIDVGGYPERLAYNPKTQELYVARRAERLIARVDADGKVEIVEQVRNGRPDGVGVDTGSGDVYFTTYNEDPNNREGELKKITPDGTISTVYSASDYFGDVAVDSRDHIVYVATFFNVLEFKDDKLLKTFGIPGYAQSIAYDTRTRTLYSSNDSAVFKIRDGGADAIGKWSHPRTIAVDSVTGNLYVADQDATGSNNDLVKRLTPGGEITTIAAGIRSCLGLAVDEQTRDLYAADFNKMAAIKFVRALNL